MFAPNEDSDENEGETKEEISLDDTKEKVGEIIKMMDRKYVNLAKTYDAFTNENCFSRSKKGDIIEEEKNQASEIGGSGSFIRPENVNFQLIVSLLVGIKRSVSSLVYMPFKELDAYQFQRTETFNYEWLSKDAKQLI